MKIFLTTLFNLLLLAISFPGSAQNHNKNPKESLFVYVSVQQMPGFPGGQDSLLSYISRNVRYPLEAMKNGEQGIAFISFVVDSLGQVIYPEVLKSATPTLDAEAIRIISKMPRWSPGKHLGRPVAVALNLPVRFQISNPALLPLETQPQFPGGEAALAEFIAANLKYPPESRKKNIEGTVEVSFTVEETGELTDLKVEQSPFLELSAAAVNLIFEMPKWQPASTKIQPVAVRHRISIPFSIAGIRKDVATEVKEKTKIKRKLPKFPGGQTAMMNYLRTSIKYPPDAFQDGKEGLVVLSFVVDQTGFTKNIAILQSLDQGMDAEAIRVVKAMPQWRPGTDNGKPVNVRFTLPVRFALTDNR